tara:strand:+ start:450 stop:617 length:168 start_codon:yes stop_codon:yes gene_type:complete
MKKYTYESFSETIDFAESLGWVDDVDEWNNTIAEDLEAEAILYIEMQGYEVIYDD